MKLIEQVTSRSIGYRDCIKGRCYREIKSGIIYFMTRTQYNDNFPADIVSGELIISAARDTMRFVEVEAEVHLK